MNQPAAWIFQANPNKYNIRQSLRIEAEEFWNCKQHLHKIKNNDRVLVWICGKTPGIYAVGTVVCEPVFQADSVKGVGYWANPVDGLRPLPRVLVRYDRVLLDRPLLKLYLQWDPELWNLSLFRQPRGTNFKVTPEEWAALEIWLQK